ncbi:hypothetical protein J437_LFUL006374, partial [Ladona fulva]
HREKDNLLILRESTQRGKRCKEPYEIRQILWGPSHHMENGRKFLMERRDIFAARNIFLRKMHLLRTSGDERPIIYLDETWVNQNHSRAYVCQD